MFSVITIIKNSSSVDYIITQYKNREESMLLVSTAAFSPGAGPLHTQIPVLLESDHHMETDHRKYYSTGRGQGSRIPTYKKVRF